MALTQVKTTGLADDAVTTDKLANAINTERTANTAKPTLANDGNNRVVTGDGSGGLNGEANLTFDGTNLGINTSSPSDLLEIHPASNLDGLTFKDTGDTYPALTFDINRSGSDQFLGNIRGMWNGTTVANIILETGSDTTNKDDGVITFRTASAGTPAERLRIESGGNVKINDGDLVIGGTGHGINFADSQTNAAGMTSETLDSYEEGTFTPSLSFGQSNTGITYDTAGADTTTGHYTKIGRLVNCSVYIKLTSKGSATGVARVEGLPFTPDTNNGGKGSASIGYFADMDLDAPLTLWTSVNGTSMVVRRIHTNWDYLVNCGEGNFNNTSVLSFSVSYIVP
tara:strand:+ start:34 stop:1056 length:1023 start_codon:yes stop_codon:yes gene_type:complete